MVQTDKQLKELVNLLIGMAWKSIYLDKDSKYDANQVLLVLDSDAMSVLVVFWMIL